MDQETRGVFYDRESLTGVPRCCAHALEALSCELHATKRNRLAADRRQITVCECKASLGRELVWLQASREVDKRAKASSESTSERKR